MKYFIILFFSIFLLSPLYAENIVPPPAATPPKINVNTADIKALTQSVKGIGRKRAEAIIQYREKNGVFKSLNDLAKVPGLGKNFVEHHQADINRIFVLK